MYSLKFTVCKNDNMLNKKFPIQFNSDFVNIIYFEINKPKEKTTHLYYLQNKQFYKFKFSPTIALSLLNDLDL